jgi:sugar phosphate isomerase/epimerase
MELSTAPELSLAHVSVLHTPPCELVALAAKIGYRAIGLALHPSYPGSPHYTLPAGSAASREMQQRLSDEDVRVAAIEFAAIGEYFDPHDWAGLLDAASALNARSLNVRGDDRDRYRLTENFARLCELAMPLGIDVELEFMAWRQVATLDDALDVVIAAGQPNGGVLLDALHLWRSGGAALDVCAAPAGTLRSVQLCDAEHFPPTSMQARIQESRTGRLAPGEGALPLADLLAELPDGIAISLGVPANGTAAPEHHARRLFESTQRLLASTSAPNTAPRRLQANRKKAFP